jgi:hypothetical protein
MIESTFNILLVIAAAGSYLAISRRIDERLGGAFATVLWGVLTASSFDITVYSGGSSFAESAPELAFVALAGGIVMLVFTMGAATGHLPDATQTRFTS